MASLKNDGLGPKNGLLMTRIFDLMVHLLTRVDLNMSAVYNSTFQLQGIAPRGLHGKGGGCAGIPALKGALT